MATRKSASRKPRKSPRKGRRLLSVRTALILELSLLSALGGAGLLHLAHRPTVQILLSSIGILALALKFFDSMIE